MYVCMYVTHFNFEVNKIYMYECVCVCVHLHT